MGRSGTFVLVQIHTWDLVAVCMPEAAAGNTLLQGVNMEEALAGSSSTLKCNHEKYDSIIIILNNT